MHVHPRHALAVLLLAPSFALAQDGTDPVPMQDDEALIEVPEQEDVTLRPTEGAGEGSLTGLDLPDPRPPRGSELPEGTVINEAQGIVVPLTTGGWAFVFDTDIHGDADPPMVLQPSMQTAAMLRLVGAREETITFSVSGEVQRYLGRHYLLPDRFDVVAGTGAEEQEPVEEIIEGVEQQLEAGGEESAADLAAQVDRAVERQNRRPVPNATRPNEDGTTERNAASIVPGGTMVIDVPGRAARDASGLWVFTTDSDADSTADGELVGEITLVPCLMLQAMERDLARSTTRTRLTLSGRVLVFEGANYLLPTLYRLAPDTGGNLTSAQ